ncbi:MAG: amidohydrolase family protein [Gemmatimonadota bacterium]|nr:amidohydrolase family protein [Gemmatimonadota bacterium]
MKKHIAPDSRVEKEILAVEDFLTNKVPETYSAWAWTKIPEELFDKLDSYHRFAALELEAPPVDWDSEFSNLGVEGAVDGHSHIEGYPKNPELVEELERILDRAGIRYIVNLGIETLGDDFIRELEEGWLKGPLAERVLSFPTFEWQFDRHGFVEESCAFLTRVRDLGVRGMKVHKELGITVTAGGKVVRLTDTRVKEIFSHAGSLGLPVWIHYGDPYNFFMPLEGNKRKRELTCFPDWHHYSRGFDEQAYWRLHEDFFRLLEDTPGTKFNVPHLANYPWDKIDEFAGLLLSHDNLYSDVSARMAVLGKGKCLGTRESRTEKAREFLTRCRDKILWGTDILPTDRLYKLWAMLLRSDIEDIDYTWASFYPGQGDWLVDGLGLDKELLEKLCRDVAMGLIGLRAD